MIYNILTYYEPNERSTRCGLTEKRVQNVTKLLMKGTL